MFMFKNKKILITGGTGSLGSALAVRLLQDDVDTLRIYSRDEWKQTQMESSLKDERLRFLIGDVRDKERLGKALEDIDIVIHTAALKQVPVAEYNPFEFVKTNVYGSQNLIDACIENQVETTLAVSTDKAVSPLNTYGATKLLMERLFISANFYKGTHDTKFLCVRYGNVLGSRGSILPRLIEQIRNGKQVTITDLNMTRFNITMTQALDLIFRAIKNGIGGEVFVPKLRAYKVETLRDALLDLMNSNVATKLIPIRPGEKHHEVLINYDEIKNTFYNGQDYVIFDKQTHAQFRSKQFPEYPVVSMTKQYSSDNATMLTIDEIKKILLQEKLVSV